MLRVVASFAAIALVSYFLPRAEASVCPMFFALIGPCVSGLCPNNATCICGCCCQSVLMMVMNRRSVSLGGARTGSGKACRDRLPDCLEKRDLCSNAQFIDFMTEKCPRTCNRCPKVSKQPGREGTEMVEEEEPEDVGTSIAEWYGNNHGGYGSYGNGYGSGYGGGYGSGFGSSNYGNYYG